MKGSEWRVGMFYFIFARIAAQQRQAYYVQLLCSTCMDVNKRRVQQLSIRPFANAGSGFVFNFLPRSSPQLEAGH